MFLLSIFPFFLILSWESDPWSFSASKFCISEKKKLKICWKIDSSELFMSAHLCVCVCMHGYGRACICVRKTEVTEKVKPGLKAAKPPDMKEKCGQRVLDCNQFTLIIDHKRGL